MPLRLAARLRNGRIRPGSATLSRQIIDASTMEPKRRIVAVALLTEAELRLLGQGFDRFCPVDETPCFVDLLLAIDEAHSRLTAVERDAPGPMTVISRPEPKRPRRP